MTQTTSQLRRYNPMWYFERNYSALLDMLYYSQVLESGSLEFALAGTQIELSVLERSRYTLLVAIRQSFTPGRDVCLLSDLRFKVRLYLDAKVAEVVSYQGQHPVLPRYPYPNRRMYHPDEKRQTNLILYDWLSHCSRLDFMRSLETN